MGVSADKYIDNDEGNSLGIQRDEDKFETNRIIKNNVKFRCES